MADVVTHNPTTPEAGLTQLIDRLGKIAALAESADARMDEITRLQGLSDAELARAGIPRDCIVEHVMRDLFES